MSMMKSLAKVAAGVMLAKGIGNMMQRQQQPQGRGGHSTGGGILGDLLGGSGNTRTGGGGLGDMIGQVLGGRTAANPGTGRPYGGQAAGGASGGLGGLIDSYTRRAGGPPTGSSTGGGILGGVLGGAAGGMLGDLLRGPAQRDSQPRNDATFGEVLNDAMVRQDEPGTPPTPEQNAVAGLMLKAMIQAAKADGEIDAGERERLMGQLGDLDAQEQQFIREQMAAPVDARALAREVPEGLERQIYMMSVLAIDFDHQEEAVYLRELAQALGLRQDAVDDVHQQIGVKNLYS